ncbi:hypothetical protein BJ508DRAFT_239033 [Ascobolus immersus RN42]|uniref:Uncharacterized protein n=1 Tax=Ascobolus immersus RN42 TaxID=1160509 RepID=A0A3N4I5C6_ASCIM|nr:hypothetical protein BJ508DRAFT_239033 [Ascobolus immersus RN42]
MGQNSKTYSTKDSRVVTHRSTNLAIRSLTMGERTGSRIFFNLWRYVTAHWLQYISKAYQCKLVFDWIMRHTYILC